MSLRRLPVEILQEIFSRVAARIYLHAHRPRCAGFRSPWCLVLVCKYWQDVVLSTPWLWSDICLQLIPSTEASHEPDTLLSIWSLCLVRSLNHPLTIEFSCGIDDTEVASQIPLFMKPLMENAQRWETVILRASFSTLSSCLSNNPVQYSRLRRLCIDNLSLNGHPQDPIGPFRDAPLLSSIYLNSLPYYGQNLGGVTTTWSHISHLKIEVDFGRFCDLMVALVNTPNLVTLDYSAMYSHSGGSEPPPLELPHLQQIVWACECEDSPHTPNFFNCLTAPQLSVLEVYRSCVDQDVEAIRGCLQRSECSIAYLNVATISAPRLYSLLSLTPDVKTLIIENAPTPSNDNPTTHDPPGDQIELAQLRKLVLKCQYDGNCSTLGLLKAPQLSALEGIGRCGDFELEDIRDFLQRSKCSVTSLKLQTPRLSSLLKCTVDVETLVIPRVDKEVLISLLEDLTFDYSSSSWLFPKLKKIVLDFDIAAGLPFDAFIAVLKSRLWAPPNSLVRLQCHQLLKELEFGSAVSKHMRQWVRKTLTPQEPLVMTYKEPEGQWFDEWQFSTRKDLGL